MVKIDYSLRMFDEIKKIKSLGRRPWLLLHLCCAPCSSYVIELLQSHFEIVLYFYDPNIHPYSEYEKRRNEASDHAANNDIPFIEGPYDVKNWCDLTKGHENDPEKGERCALCFDMRMSESARFAGEIGCEYFATVLTISPHKDAARINNAGTGFAKKYGLKYLVSDFKKKDGFKKSIKLGKQYGFYRQDYCGCVYSRRNIKKFGLKGEGDVRLYNGKL